MIWGSTIWLLFFLVVLLWLPQNVHHEGMHAIAVKIYGANDIKIYPFPKWSDGWFPDSFAYMTYRFDYVAQPSSNRRAIISLAPQIANTFWLIVLLPVLIYVSLPLWLYTLVSAIITVNFIDAAVNISSVFRSIPVINQDIWDFIKFSKINVSVMRFFVLLWYILFGLVILIPLF